MSLNDLINIQVSATGALPAQAGFGVPLIAGWHTHYADLVRYYSSLTGLTTDGFTALDPIYIAASIILDQSPTVTQFAVGRRTSVDLQVLTLTASSTSALDIYSATLTDSAGVSHTLAVNSTGVPATDGATIATAITAFALAGCTVTHTGALVTLTHTAQHLTNITGWNYNILQLADTTADPGLATDLANILAFDATGWYGLCLANNSPNLVKTAMAFAEANLKIAAFNCSDSAIPLGTVGNVALVTQASNYTRSAGIYSGATAGLLSYAGAAALGRNLPPAPGSITWAYKPLTGVGTDVLSQTAVNNITAASWNYYTSYKGSPVFLNGVSPAGEYMDIVQGIDWFKDLMQTDLFALFVGSEKVPFTDAGGDQVLAVIKSDLQQAVNANFANPGDATTPAPTAAVPLVANISASNRSKRIFAGSTFSFKLAGAIQNLTVNGTVTA